jgi:D-alanyl-lipoteichoic acid acyltransferase DltB (MBOAT superfamily)
MAWEVSYALLILFSTVVDYVSAIQMEKATTQTGKKKWLWASLVSNLGLLFTFKYFNFFSDSLNALFQSTGLSLEIPYHELLLPVGISFYTFQTLSYTIDVYRGDKKAERHFGIFALYVSFFPQLVAGPIERSTRLLPQFFEQKNIQYQDISDGFKQVAWGFFKKVVIADRVALLVNQVYASPESYPGFPLILATFFFAIQIYCDFSGYSDIAIGTARMMGFRLMENFRKPYFAKSIGEFWGRWHISLSTWFRDYVYIPLGGNRVSDKRWMLNIMATFTISGLWHGANWTFIIWGALNGAYLLAEKSVHKHWKSYWDWSQSKRFGKLWAIGLTFLLTCFAWVFFRAETISDAWYILTHLGSNPGYILSLPRDLVMERSFLFNLGLREYEFCVALCSIFLLSIVDWKSRNETIVDWLNEKGFYFRGGFVYTVVMLTLMFGQFGNQAFIYFQF